MATRQVFFDANSLLKLLVHYTETAETEVRVPLDAELKQVKASATLRNWLGLVVRSKEWEGRIGRDGVLEPLHIRYEGNRIFTWHDRKQAYGNHWTEPLPGDVIPKRQE